VGGYLDDKIPSNKSFIYDPTTDVWQEGKSMPTARAALTAQFIENILYAVGGTDDNNPLTVNEAYDPTTDTWTSKANMPTPRQHMASGVSIWGYHRNTKFTIVYNNLKVCRSKGVIHMCFLLLSIKAHHKSLF